MAGKLHVRQIVNTGSRHMMFATEHAHSQLHSLHRKYLLISSRRNYFRLVSNHIAKQKFMSDLMSDEEIICTAVSVSQIL